MSVQMLNSSRKLIIFILTSVILASCTVSDPWVVAHNKYRCMHDVPALQYDSTLTDVAQWRVTNCAFCKHCTCQGSSCDPKYSKQYAENIACWNATPGDAVASWYSEIKNYDYNNPQWNNNTGHFINMVVNSASKVGCACSGKECTCVYDSLYGTSPSALKTAVPPAVKTEAQCAPVPTPTPTP